MSARLRSWFDGTRRWATWLHLLAAGAVIVASAMASSLVFGARGVDAVPASLDGTPDPRATTSASAQTAASRPPTSVGSTTPTGGDAAPEREGSAAPATTNAVSDEDDPTRLIDARAVLASIPVELENRTGGYDRDLFAVWIDTDRDGCDTRDEVLRAESLERADSSSAGCIPVPGLWRSTYDGTDLTDASELDVDHLVSLKEAWDSGAWSWTPERRIAYANDLTDGRTLVAVSATSNRSKGDRDPSNWLPEDAHALCPFVGDWIAVKARWSMTMDPSEHGRIGNLIDDRCPRLTIDIWPATP